MEKITRKDRLNHEMKREVRRLRRMAVNLKDEEDAIQVEGEIRDTLDLLKETKR